MKGFFLVSLIVSFIAGLLVGASLETISAFNLGYKSAYAEVESLLKEGAEGNIDFSISGLPFKFRPQTRGGEADGLVISSLHHSEHLDRLAPLKEGKGASY